MQVGCDLKRKLRCGVEYASSSYSGTLYVKLISCFSSTSSYFDVSLSEGSTYPSGGALMTAQLNRDTRGCCTGVGTGSGGGAGNICFAMMTLVLSFNIGVLL
jgi:hypothetical protein